MKEYQANDWQHLAGNNGLTSFDAIWALDIGWFEEPNQRRGGWSGVSQAEFPLVDGGSVEVFIKRQQDHTARTLAHPITGILTFRREFHNLSRFIECDVPTLDVLYFAERKLDGKRQAILVTRALTGFQPLDICLKQWQKTGWPGKPAWHRFIQRLARIMRGMHQHRIQHNCLFPKHVFLKDIDTDPDIRLIDLEKAKHTFCPEQAMMRDLDSFNRRTHGVKTTDRLRFLLAYYDKPRVDQQVRKTWSKLVKQMRRKGHFPVRGQ